jgi:hypothetical protein
MAKSHVSRIVFVVVVKMIVLLMESMQSKQVPIKMSFGDRALSAMVDLYEYKTASGPR